MLAYLRLGIVSALATECGGVLPTRNVRHSSFERRSNDWCLGILMSASRNIYQSRPLGE